MVFSAAGNHLMDQTIHWIEEDTFCPVTAAETDDRGFTVNIMFSFTFLVRSLSIV